MQTLKDILFTSLTTFAVLMIIGLIVAGCSNDIPQASPIVIDWNKTDVFEQSKRDVIIIKDNRRNLQWDAFHFDRSIIIIPGTERPIK